jgi:hypothetical protein
MELTTAQKATLKTNVQGNGDTNALFVSGDLQGLAALYNADASPDFWVWRTSVSKAELTNETSVDGTTFNWSGTGFITRTQGERDAWRELFDQNGTVNASLPQVRQAFLDIFSGPTAPAPANRTHLATIGRRKATRLEKLFATGTGSTGSPAVMALNVEGPISYQAFIGL